MREKIKLMFEMQDSFNRKVHPEWRTQGYPWYRAIWVECAEMMDHIGWKWWKNCDANPDQVKLELVDIWHFGMSQIMQFLNIVEATEYAVKDWESSGNPRVRLPLVAEVEGLATTTLRYERFNHRVFVHACVAAGMDFDELFGLYVGKNVLNHFRQTHGYKEGTYRKIWVDGREDNVHLSEVLAALPEGPIDLATVEAELLSRYREGV